MNGLTALAWLVATATTVSFAAQVSRRVHPRAGALRVVDVTVIAWACLATSSLVLGNLGLLNGPALLVVVPAAAALSRIVSGRNPREGGPEAGDTPQPDPDFPGWAKALWAAQLGFWGAHVASKGLAEFTNDFDSLMYHIPLVDHWLQAGSLYAPDSSHWYNPGISELMGLWAVAPFPGDFLIVLGNIPATLLMAVGALELGSLLGLSTPLRHLTAAAVAANFVVLNQLVDAGNDVAVAGLFLACLCHGLRFVSQGRRADLVLGAIDLGLLCGVKYYALGYGCVAWVTIGLLAAARRGPREGLRWAAAGAAGVACLGGYWYARNALVGGSPLFPLGFVPGTGVLDQTYPHSFRSSFLGNGRPEVWPLAVRAIWKMSGPWPLAAVVALPVVVVRLAMTGLRGRRDGTAEPGAARLALALLIVGSAATLAVTPFAVEDVPGSLNHLRWAYTPARYGLSFLCVASVGLSVLLQDAAGSARWRLAGAGTWLPPALAGGSALYQIALVDPRREIDWLAVTTTALAVVALRMHWEAFRGQWPGRARAAAVTAAAVAVAGLSLGAGRFAPAWESRFNDSYDWMFGTEVFTTIAALEPAPTRICAFDYRGRPFFGGRRQYRLCQPGRIPSYDWVVRYLAERDVTHVVVRSHRVSVAAGWDAYREVGSWVAAHPRDFALIHRDRLYSLYRFRRPEAVVADPDPTPTEFRP